MIVDTPWPVLLLLAWLVLSIASGLYMFLAPRSASDWWWPLAVFGLLAGGVISVTCLIFFL